MKKQIVGTVVFAFFVAAAYMMSCLLCIANSDYVFQDDYARMSQEIVEQSIEMKANR